LKNLTVKYKKLHPNAKVPKKNKRYDAAYDVYALTDTALPSRGTVCCKTGLAVVAPPGYYYTIEGRSGLGKLGVSPFRGILDATYSGEIEVTLVNHSDAPYLVKSGDRICQLIFHEALEATFEEIIDEEESDADARGVAGFGSSGR
jgi:dUTP pyrophosphatase